MGNNQSKFKGDDHPVEMVSWQEAMAFCRKATEKLRSRGSLPEGWEVRLPFEMEWEYACQGGNRSKGYTYSGSNDLYDVGWYDGNSGNKTHEVGAKTPNELGLYDMSGNVWEWCLDNGDASRRVFRGGSWDCVDGKCRCVTRCSNYLSSTYSDYGFRVVLGASAR